MQNEWTLKETIYSVLCIAMEMFYCLMVIDIENEIGESSSNTDGGSQCLI